MRRGEVVQVMEIGVSFMGSWLPPSGWWWRTDVVPGYGSSLTEERHERSFRCRAGQPKPSLPRRFLGSQLLWLPHNPRSTVINPIKTPIPFFLLASSQLIRICVQAEIERDRETAHIYPSAKPDVEKPASRANPTIPKACFSVTRTGLVNTEKQFTCWV
ncbi:hypothetical protein GQ43DRAFT_60886 [Delitschia confertaspora ATCC 74209]|uniref:Uncharacterized protein n=1 Tax=Delitschia confertaspora ATCC 74209 TaxID=1513339 RepID=A0A9P4JKG8_9PLEO|nr:hypothetical protein GQ43DRAFT_60886 [Delitschia confertaspora ATCC 74209]